MTDPTKPDEQIRPMALVIGVTGGIGGEVARAMIDRGWRIRALSRNPKEAGRKASWVGGVDWLAGNAANEADVVRAANGAHIIFHGANPPRYKNWQGLAIPMLKNTIAAARRSGARIIFPGNVYNFGDDAGTLIKEDSPQHPTTRKGRVRVEMENLLKAAANESVRSLVVRAGDFFGPHQPASWFRDAMVRPGRPVASVTYPGDLEAGHAWAYLPDLAQTIARLAEIEYSLPAFECVHFRGHALARGGEMIDAIRRVCGNPNLPTRTLPWLLFYLGAPFSTFFREVLEMRYLWNRALSLDNSKLISLIGEEPHTPLDAAVRETLTALGCLKVGSE